MKLVFLGRLDATKGLDVLLAALDRAAGLALELHIYGLPDDEPHAQQVRAHAMRDSRVALHDQLPHAELLVQLANYDALVIPSQVLETGPLVALEAFAVGLPVLGSRLGGIAETVRDDVDGLLVPPQDAGAWAEVLRRITSDPDLLVRLRRGVRAPRTMQQVAAEMEPVYSAALVA